MRFVGQTNNFNRDIKKLVRGKYRNIINAKLGGVVNKLANDVILDYSYHDHALTGNWEGYRECHLAFDLVLIYKLEDEDNTLELARIGSHTEVLGL